MEQFSNKPILKEGNLSPKILIVAPNASYAFGGEAFIPLKYFEILNKKGFCPLLLTHIRNFENLHSYLGTLENVYFIKDTSAHRFLSRINPLLPAFVQRNLIATLIQLLDSVLQHAKILNLVQAGKVEIIHQPTPVSPLAPSHLHRFGLPTVIGPMNGGMTYPQGYGELESFFERKLIIISRNIGKILNFIISGKRKATILLVANERTKNVLKFLQHRDVRIIPENGVDISVWYNNRCFYGKFNDSHIEQKFSASLNLIYMGWLVDWKKVEITLEAVAIARAKGADITLDILGDGPERSRLEKISQELEIEAVIKFHRFLPQSACADILRTRLGNGALILNSVHECGGAVVLEAMALGMPVIASDWGGPSDYIDAKSGILVSPVPRETFAERLAEAILKLASEPDLINQLGLHAKSKVIEIYDWDKKVDQILDIYADAIRSFNS